jgi:hypothetical protein
MSAYSRSSRKISSSIAAKRFFDASSFSFFTARADLQLNQPASIGPSPRASSRFHLDPRRALVDQVDRLVGQEAVGDVAVRQLRRGDIAGPVISTPWWIS